MSDIKDAVFYPAEQDGMTPAIQMEAISFSGKDPDLINYLLLLKLDCGESNEYEDEFVRSWHVSTGRQYTYDYLKKLINTCAVDTDFSYVLAEGTKDFSKALTVRQFMILMKEKQMITDFTDWNVDDYRLDPTIEDRVHPLSECNDDHSLDVMYAV